MLISDDVKAAACLEKIGYYRLSGYWHLFRQTRIDFDHHNRPTVISLDKFKPGTEFQHAHDLYVFDKRLRLLFLDAIERVEIGLRVDVAFVLGAHSPWAHRDSQYLRHNFAVQKTPPDRIQTQHDKWLEKQDKLAAGASDDFVKHFRSKYQDPYPIWIAIELWDFGLLSILYEGMQFKDQEVISKKYGIPRSNLTASWTRSINHVRNICAHHGRLWNRSLVDQPKLTKVGEISLLDHIASDIANPSNPLSAGRIYAVAAILQFLLRRINPSTSWAERLKNHVSAFPAVPGASSLQMGFPPEWLSLPLWQP